MKYLELLSFCLFIFNNSFCEGGKSTLKGKNTNESVPSSIRNLTLLKRQLGDNIDDDSNDGFGSVMERESVFAREEEAKEPAATPLKGAGKNPRPPDGNNCQCNYRGNKEEPDIRKSLSEFERKLLPSLKKDNSRDLKSKMKTLKKLIGTLPPTTTVGPLKIELNESHFELKEIEFQTNVAIKEVCPHYKDVPKLEIERMADVWQLLYYKSQQKLSCFKIYIKQTTPESRMKYQSKYSNFNDTINWNECYLELTSIGKPREDKKHFLQGAMNDRGILENMVVSEHTADDTKIITLQEQSPDQWLVTKTLLIMRDCDNGDVVIFTRIPFQPDKREVEEAMNMFGENGINGTTPCFDSYSTETDYFGDNKFDILS